MAGGAGGLGLRRVTLADLPAVTAFLSARAQLAMFPLSNLARFGLDGADDFAPSMWVDEQKGRICGVLTITRGGAVLPVLPETDPQKVRAALAGREVANIVGPAPQVRGLVDALGLRHALIDLDRTEPQFLLNLDRLIIPEGPGELCSLQTAEPETMIRWRGDYTAEILGMDPARAAEDGRRAYHSYVLADSHRVLMAAGQPLATTGFNAVLPEIVQIGGVYTPPALRGQGHARRALALHLAEARGNGVTRAVLSSASPAASRAYRAIGFEQVGEWTLFLMSRKVRIGD